MKLVINKCFGGFGLSKEAVLALSKTKCSHLEITSLSSFGKGWKEEDKSRFLAYIENGFYSGYAIEGGNVIEDNHRAHDPYNRACPYLVELVEAGEVPFNGQCAKLGVVEIPDDVLEFEIDDYDGSETVKEVHRSWG